MHKEGFPSALSRAWTKLKKELGKLFGIEVSRKLSEKEMQSTFILSQGKKQDKSKKKIEDMGITPLERSLKEMEHKKETYKKSTDKTKSKKK